MKQQIEHHEDKAQPFHRWKNFILLVENDQNSQSNRHNVTKVAPKRPKRKEIQWEYRIKNSDDSA